jgi:hypothetical protein
MGGKEQYRDYVMGFVKRVGPVVDHGEGATLWDVDGKEYIDCFAGISVTNAGHGNKKIIEAAKAQADKLVHACSYVYHVPAVGALAERLAEITPGKLQKTFFSNSGAEALGRRGRLRHRHSEFGSSSRAHGAPTALRRSPATSARRALHPPACLALAPYRTLLAETTPDKCTVRA